MCPPWIFKHGTSIVDRGLKVLFFGLYCYILVFFFVALPLENFLPTPLYTVYLRSLVKLAQKRIRNVLNLRCWNQAGSYMLLLVPNNQKIFEFFLCLHTSNNKEAVNTNFKYLV